VAEQTAVRAITGGIAQTEQGTVRAEVVVRATEAYTAQLAGQHRALAPVYSLMVATEPVPATSWDEIGLASRPTFSDARHLVIYGQRTADGRLAFGGRGAPYHYGSRIDPGFDHNETVFAALRATLRALFPALHDVSFTHAWGGPLALPRDWHCSVGYDRDQGVAWAGGYVGDGVSTTNLAGRTLADLITGQDTDLTRLAWVGHRSPRWEPEPLRWLGINSALWLTAGADASEVRKNKPSRWRTALLDRLTGG
jgi:glycine/D-amino acid oxidase-like deaminating enzyme